MDFEEVLKRRYSVRQFDSRPVEEDKIIQILELERLAPTAVNNQPQRILVLKSPEDMTALAECTKYVFGAPAAFIVATDESKAWVRPYDQANFALVDGCIAATYIMLAIEALGLGTCWVGHFDPARVREKFKFPSSLQPVAIFPFGYPAQDAKPSSRHDSRLPLEETVFYGHF